MVKYHIMTLFPEIIDQATGHSIIQRAKDEGLIEVNTYNIRDFSTNKHKKVDDYPYGGGPGMVMSVEPIVLCHRHIMKDITGSHITIYMSPKGEVFRQQKAKEMTSFDNIILLCGHYEGIDQRAIDMIVDEEISIGDYILTGGEIPAVVIIEATARLIDGVLGQKDSHEDESFSNNLLEYPHYTRPREFEGREVPEVLLGGNHKFIEQWRYEEALKLTQARRRDILDLSQPIEEAKTNKKRSEKANIKG